MPTHLIHIGFPKAGSTSLQAWFSGHPRFQVAGFALGGYPDAIALARHEAESHVGPRWLVTSAENLSCPRFEDHDDGLPESPVISARRARVCRALRDLFGEPHVLIVTRGFHGFTVSGYSEYVRRGGTLGPLELWESHRVDMLADMLDYDATVRLYSEAFGSDRVIVLPFELLRDDPVGFAAILEARLGIEPSGAAPLHANPSLSTAELFWYPRLSRWVFRATRPLGRVGRRLERLYRERIGGPDLRRIVALVGRVLPDRTVQVSVPPEMVEACRGRASSLASLPHYERYANAYLNDAGHP